MYLKRLLNNHCAFSLKIGKPWLAVERSDQEDRNAIILQTFLNTLEGLNAVHVRHHNVADNQTG